MEKAKETRSEAEQTLTRVNEWFAKSKKFIMMVMAAGIFQAPLRKASDVLCQVFQGRSEFVEILLLILALLVVLYLGHRKKKCNKKGFCPDGFVEAQSGVSDSTKRFGSANVSLFKFNQRLESLAKDADVTGAEQMIAHMQKLGAEPNVVSYSHLIYAYAKVSDVAGAEHWLSRMVAAGVEPNVISYCNAIHACAKAADPERAAGWITKMKQAGVAPNDRCYNAVIDACAKAGDVSMAEQWLKKMVDDGFKVDTISYNGVDRKSVV